MQLDWRVEQAKAERLELLYRRDGRHRASHRLHGLFTGLAELAPSASEIQRLPTPTAASLNPMGAVPSAGTDGELPTAP